MKKIILHNRRITIQKVSDDIDIFLSVRFWPKKIVILPQPLFSLDLAFADFFLFPILKTPTKERFATNEEMKEKLNLYQKARCRRGSRIGKNAGISVLYPREITF